MAKNERGDNELSLEGRVVGFMGFGFMAQSLARGFISQKVLEPNQIAYFDSNSALMQELSANADFTSCMATCSNEEMLKCSQIIIIAVKPQVVLGLLHALSSEVDRERHSFVSICAGVTLNQLQSALPQGTRVIRTMPNAAVSVGMGTTVMSAGRWSSEEDGDMVCKLFGSVGICRKLQESQLNVVTAISGSGPAFAYIGLDAVGDAGAFLGMPKNTAQLLAAQTMMGAAKMFLQSGQHAGPLKDAVCSPGGTTLAGVMCLEEGAFRSVLMKTVMAAHDRSVQLEALAANAAVDGGGAGGGGGGG